MKVGRQLLVNSSSGPSTIQLGGHEFGFVSSLQPECDAAGTIIAFSPQAFYSKRDRVLLNRYGSGTFCKFRISVPKGLVEVYALVVDGTVHYIGECQDLRERFGDRGYGSISPRNCYIGGQATNCKINHFVLEMTQAGHHVDLYFHATSQRKAFEQELVAQYAPALNS